MSRLLLLSFSFSALSGFACVCKRDVCGLTRHVHRSSHILYSYCGQAVGACSCEEDVLHILGDLKVKPYVIANLCFCVGSPSYL